MNLKKVHVTLDRKILRNRNESEIHKLLDRVIKEGHLHEVNKKRMHRYGIVSGLIDAEEFDPELIAMIENIPGVISCQEDSEQRLVY